MEQLMKLETLTCQFLNSIGIKNKAISERLIEGFAALKNGNLSVNNKKRKLP